MEWGTKTIPNTKTTRFVLSASVSGENYRQGVPMGGKIEMREERESHREMLHTPGSKRNPLLISLYQPECASLYNTTPILLVFTSHKLVYMHVYIYVCMYFSFSNTSNINQCVLRLTSTCIYTCRSKGMNRYVYIHFVSHASGYIYIYMYVFLYVCVCTYT